MRKRFIALFACSALVASSLAGFAACGGGTTLTVWGAQNQQEFLLTEIERFKEAYPEYKDVKFKLGICGEGDAFSNLSTDPEAGADVYAYANDQLINLLKRGAVSQINPEVATQLLQTDYQPALESVRIGDKYYGYPFADNGFFLFYDNSVVSDEQAKDLDSIVAACKAAGKKFIFEFENSWYALSMAYGAGGTYTVEYGGETGTELINEDTNLDEKPTGSNYSYGALAGVKMNQIAGGQNKETVITTSADTAITNALNDGSFGACIRGVWQAREIRNALRETEKDPDTGEEKVIYDHFAASILPQWKDPFNQKDSEGNVKTYDMYTFSGYKLWGVNGFSKNFIIAHAFAAFLASKEEQRLRYQATGIDPTNLQLRESDEVKADPAVMALYEMIADHAILQGSFPDSYWKAAEAFGKATLTWNLSTTPMSKIEERVKTLVEGLESDVNGIPLPEETPAE